MTPGKITKDMPISYILEVVPNAVELLMEAQLNCIGCSANTMETLEQGVKGHGLSETDLEMLLTDINTLYAQELSAPQKEISQKVEIEEDMEYGKLYAIAGLSFTQAAYNKLHELAKGKKGFRIETKAGGCSGFKNIYDYTDSPEEGDQTYSLSNDLALYINNFTAEKLNGTIIDYSSGLHDAGLKFINPNVEKSCHCGVSFNF